MGTALLSVTLLMFLFSAIAFGAALVVRVEVRIAERFRQSAEALYAAQAGLEVAIGELGRLADWTPVVTGVQSSRFSQGAFAGAKAVPGGGAVDVCCGPQSLANRVTVEARMARTPTRQALEWRPFLWTTFDALVSPEVPGRLFVVVFVANDEEDAGGGGNADTNGAVLLRAEAVDPGGLRRAIECLIARSGTTDEEEESAERLARPIGILTWREVR